MASRKTIKVQRSVRLEGTTSRTVRIPLGDFGRIFDQMMSGTRLCLALHRIEQARKEDGISTPSELIAWEAFSAFAGACEELGHAAGYGPAERTPE